MSVTALLVSLQAIQLTAVYQDYFSIPTILIPPSIG